VKTLNPYIDFGGRCREALDFYKSCFGGEVVALMTYADAKIETPPQFANHVLHSEFRSEQIHFMASDGRADMPATVGSNIMLSILFTDAAEQERVYAALAAGGNAHLPLHDAFWGARFGMLVDRFGINWMLNCPK
jgi:PhnB protein